MIAKVVNRLRRWLIGAIKEATAIPPAQKPMSGHQAFIKLAAARSLLDDGTGIDDAARAVGLEPEELRRWISRAPAPLRRMRRRVGTQI